MKKPISLLILIAILLSCASLPPVNGYSNPPGQKVKGICIHGDDIARIGAEKAAEEIKSAGFNTIFLLIKDPQGNVYFASPDFPVKYAILKDTVKAFHKLGIKVYVYFPVFMDKHYGLLHPSERMVSVNGKTNPYYISLLSDNYLYYIEKFLNELLIYDIDGITFDYIRFPNGEYDFSKMFESLAKSEGINFDYVKEKTYETFVYPADWKTLFLLSDTDSNIKKWIELREQVVENEAQILTEHVRNINPKVKVGVFSVARGCEFRIGETNDIKETFEYQVANFAQVPDKSFLFLDFIAPMVYLNSLKEPPEYTKYAVNKFKEANPKREVYAAINPYELSVQDIEKQILLAYSYGNGVIMFRYPLFKMGNISFLAFPKPHSEVKAKIAVSGKTETISILTGESPLYPLKENIVFVNGFYQFAKMKIRIGEKTGEKTRLPLYSGKTFRMDTAPFIKDNRTFVPIRFVSENLGASVSWNGKTREVTIERFVKIG